MINRWNKPPRTRPAMTSVRSVSTNVKPEVFHRTSAKDCMKCLLRQNEAHTYCVGIPIPPHGDRNFFHADVRGIHGDSRLSAKCGKISHGIIVFVASGRHGREPLKAQSFEAFELFCRQGRSCNDVSAEHLRI